MPSRIIVSLAGTPPAVVAEGSMVREMNLCNRPISNLFRSQDCKITGPAYAVVHFAQEPARLFGIVRIIARSRDRDEDRFAAVLRPAEIV